MRSSDAIKLLDCTRASLSLYVKQGKIKVVQLDNGRYDYDDASVYSLRNNRVHKQTYLYIFSEPRFIDNSIQGVNNTVRVIGGSVDYTLIDTDRFKREKLEQLVSLISQGRVSMVYIRKGDLISDSAEELFAMVCKVNEVKVVML